ncbi:hypothetical protein CEXT_219881 [Caerostris extrusa]|uniref:Uncharacterized protein n=1 Tax=Caerostris extrusa TaxID=172846 RepID=A0AAV4NUV3_CAEEX|nr:hypothetical protein CEXT_219881 [Caerostris extrusa]
MCITGLSPDGNFKKKILENIPWNKKHEIAFHKLKGTLVNANSLYPSVRNISYIIHSDASQVSSLSISTLPGKDLPNLIW